MSFNLFFNTSIHDSDNTQFSNYLNNNQEDYTNDIKDLSVIDRIPESQTDSVREISDLLKTQ